MGPLARCHRQLKLTALEMDVERWQAERIKGQTRMYTELEYTLAEFVRDLIATTGEW